MLVAQLRIRCGLFLIDRKMHRLSVREAQERSISDCPIQAKVREAQLHIGVDPSPGLRRGCFYMHSEFSL